MFRKQSFWKGSALLLASAMIAKLLGACFKIPLTNVLGGTGMGYFSTAYGLLLPVYALSVTGLSAAVAQTVSRAAALEHWAEVRRIRDTARLACGVLGLFLSLCMFLLAEPFAALVAAQPYALFSLLAIAPAALFGCLTAVERGYWAGTGAVPVGAGASGNRLPPCAGGRAAFCAGGCRGSAGCDAVHRHGLAVLYAAWTALREPPATGQCTGCTHGADLPAAALCDDSGGAGVSGDESHLAA